MNEILTPDLLDDPALRAYDAQAIQHFAETGEPLDPTVAARVEARADRVREKTKRHGFVNIQALLPHAVPDEDE